MVPVESHANEASPSHAAVGLVVTKDNVGIVLDTVRQARRMASDAGASFYGFYVHRRDSAERSPTLCFDREFPRVSDLSEIVTGPRGRDWTARAGPTLSPVWWHCDSGAQQCPAFPVLAVATPGEALLPGLPGIALPVFVDGASGIAVLAGREIALDDALVCDLHIRAFAIFRAVADLRLAQEEGASAMSRRELQCLKLAADGRTSEEIAAALGLSVHTANQYVAATLHKLNAVNRMHAVAKALRVGLID